MLEAANFQWIPLIFEGVEEGKYDDIYIVRGLVSNVGANDYKLSYNTPDKTTAKEMFINLIKKFNSDNINIDDEGFDLLAKSAEFCTFKDIQKFCQRLFYDTTYNSDLKIDIKSLKLNYLFIDGQTGNYLLEKETYDKDPKRKIQNNYMPEDMPKYNNKKIKLDL